MEHSHISSRHHVFSSAIFASATLEMRETVIDPIENSVGFLVAAYSHDSSP
jgi:hypothetical protein